VRRAPAVLAVLLSLCVFGCDPAPSGSPSPARSEERVAADPHASATDIIDAGGPSAVATHDSPSKAGTTLVAYVAETDTSEGPQQGAWRLYDHDGRRIADGTLGQVFEAAAVPELTVVPDGYLISAYDGPRLRHLDEDGRLSDVVRSRRSLPTRAGDVLLPRLEARNSLVYRPAEHATHRLPRLPFPDVERVALDPTGRLWAQQGWDRRSARFASSADGRAPWTRTRVPLSPGGEPQSLQVLGARVVVSTAREGSSEPRLDALWTRPVSGPPSGSWRRVAATGSRLRETEPVVGTLPDGRFVVAGANQQMYLQSSTGSFTRLRPPPALGYSSLQPTGNGLYLVGSPDNRLYRSVDGTGWDRVDR
jgi:hypothetical protein